MIQSAIYDALIITDVSGPVWSRSVGAYRFANLLRSDANTVKVIDCLSDFTDEEIEQLLNKYVSSQTIFVGISSSFIHDRDHQSNTIKTQSASHSIGLRKLIVLCRQKYPHVKIVLSDKACLGILASRGDRNLFQRTR